MAKVEAHFSDIRNEVLTVLDSAKVSIQVCMAWFTDKLLMDKVLEKLKNGIEVTVCLLDDKGNRKDNLNFQDTLDDLNNYWADLMSFQHHGGQLYIVDTELGYVHHKFVIIDDYITITGSYNWSNKAATKNKENIVVIEDSLIASKFNSHFLEIISICHTYILNSKFDPCIEHNCPGRILNVRIVDFRSTTRYFQNDVYRLGVCSDNPDHIFKQAENTVSDFIGDLIENEFEQLDNEIGDEEPQNREIIYKRRIESKIAWYLNSRLDVIVEQNSHDILGVYKITRDMDGLDEFHSIWEHDLIKPFYIDGREYEIIEKIDEF